MMKKHIALITDSYPPEIRSASHLMLECAEELTKRSYRVTVVTGCPRYNLADENQRVFPEITIENHIRVIRLKHLPHHKVNFMVRGISQLILPYLFIRKIKKYIHEHIDTVMVYSPPLPLAQVGWWLKKYRRAKFVLNIQDLFPQNAIDLGVLKNSLLIHFFNTMAKHLYRYADVITVHSVGNQQFLLKQYPDIQHKLSVLHNWVDVDAYQAPMQKNFRQLFQLDKKFIFVFAGVMGPSQHLEVIIQIAQAVKHIPDLCFLIVGDGAEKEKLQKQVIELALSNVIFKPFIKREEYASLLKSCDVGLVSLSAKNKTPVVPGKILGYMAAGLPVVAFLNRESDGHDLIQQAKCGYTAVSDDLQNMITVILRAHENRDQCAALGAVGLQYAKDHFSKEYCVNEIEQIMQ